MTKPLNAIVAVALVAAVAACAAPKPYGQHGHTVIATTSFLADIAQNVAGDRLTVTSLLPAGFDPHTYEPTPQDVARVAAADVLIINGAGFESYLDNLLTNAGGERIVVDASSGLQPRTPSEGEEAESTEADIAATICAGTAAKSTAVTAGADAATAPALPAADGTYTVALPEAAGAYSGYVAYRPDEAGDFHVAWSGSGHVSLSDGTGSGIEPETTLALECAGLSQAYVLELEAGVTYTIALTESAADTTTLKVGPLAGHHHHHEIDPHFWLDPTKVVTYVENIRQGLTTADPEGSAVYAANAEAYTQELLALDAWIQEQVQQIPPERRLLVTDHENLGYFADRYGFRIVGTIVPSVSTMASPSAQQLASLVDVIRQTGAPAVFLQIGANSQMAEQLAAETGVKVVTGLYTHSVGAEDDEVGNYIEMMEYNTNAIVSALR